jgi:hypothetical protein
VNSIAQVALHLGKILFAVRRTTFLFVGILVLSQPIHAQDLKAASYPWEGYKPAAAQALCFGTPRFS